MGQNQIVWGKIIDVSRSVSLETKSFSRLTLEIISEIQCLCIKWQHNLIKRDCFHYFKYLSIFHFYEKRLMLRVEITQLFKMYILK